jgi:hypothetical protein
MKNKTSIVTLSDSKYFDLLIELIDSIKSHKQSENVSICVLDAGLENQQINLLKQKVDFIEKAKWDIEVPSHKVKDREWLKSQVSRAFLPNYFPGFDKYIWIDCDAWVNDWSAIELLQKGCEKNSLAITQTIAPGYRDVGRVSWIFGSLALVKTQNFKHAIRSGFSFKVARKIAFAPHLNIGVFAMKGSSEGWSIWQKNLKKALSKGRVFGSEGLAINISVYVDQLKTEFLPPSCNWIISHLLPKYDEVSNKFVEPNLPNNKIGIMHLAGGYFKDKKDIRDDKNLKVEVITLEDKKILKSLRFSN